MHDISTTLSPPIPFPVLLKPRGSQRAVEWVSHASTSPVDKVTGSRLQEMFLYP